ncbi:MAG: translation elongation factor-like protein [bacterium]
MGEEKKIGLVENFFAKISVAAIKLTDDSLQVGDTIRIKGHTTDLEMTVESIQLEHESVKKADIGASVGVKTSERVREHDVIYKVLP